MDDTDVRAARVAGRTFSSDDRGAAIDWSRPVYGYLALAIAALALAVFGINCWG